MPSAELHLQGVNHQTLRQFDANPLLPDGVTLDQPVNGGLKGFLRNALGSSPGSVGPEAISAFVEAIAEYEDDWPLYSAQPFRYAAIPNLPEQQLDRSAESTIMSALGNMRFMVERFGPEVFAATSYDARTEHVVTWGASFDDDYELRVRGGSGAGTFSIDLGLGLVDRTKSRPSYKELWRTGIDTAHSEGAMGARFIRTGSGVKKDDNVKGEAFDEFRKRHRIMPQKLLGLVGLYFMRELEPDYALALSTGGAKQLSTLSNSKSECDYSGIFKGIGFRPSQDPDWLLIDDFEDGFYEALARADIKKHEAHRLHEAVEGLNEMELVAAGEVASERRLFQLCTDGSRRVLEHELAIAMLPAPMRTVAQTVVQAKA